MIRQNTTIDFMKPMSLIVAVDEQAGFGKDGKIPWYFPEDLKHFKKATTGHACIMGRKTYSDMYDMVMARKKDKNAIIKDILPQRECYVVSNTLSEAPGATVVPNIRAAVEQTEKNEIFAIGGEKIYIEALPWVNKVYMTVVAGDYLCDRFFPTKYLLRHFTISAGEKVSDSLSFVEYTRIRP